jgi:FAS-associated factor 2
MDLDSLSQDQRASLDQYTAVTNQALEAAIPILQRAEWNVQVRRIPSRCCLLTLSQIAISRFFDGEPETDALAEALNSPPVDTRRQEVLASGFSSSPSRPPRFAPAPRIVPPPSEEIAIRPFFPISLIFTLFNFVSSLAGRAFRTVFLRVPILPALLARLQARSASSRRPLHNTRDTAARFVREFQEQYGPHQLPWLETGYAPALDRAKRELKYLLVVLLSPEHDDTAAYVTETLLAPETAAFLNDPQNNVLLWGGSVHDAEAYQVAAAFGVTKLPYTALVARCPSESASLRATSPFGASSSGMNILLAMSGTPDASSSSTSDDAASSTHPAAAALLSRVRAATRAHGPHLRALRGAAAERDAARALRDEQDAAYERSLARDRERARAKREKEARERRRGERAAQRDEWRRWRAARLAGDEPPPEQPAEKGEQAVRVSIRMPGGERVVRRFRAERPVEEVYALVECWPLLSSADASSLSKEAGKPAGYEHSYAFRLVSPMPRVVFGVDDAGSIGERIGRSANLIVESAADEDEDEDEE